MNELITIHTRDDQVQTVDARELHAFLEVGKDFSTWIKDRIKQYDFVENQDFVLFPNFGEKYKNGRPTKEYALTISMAKELSMVERSPKGKQARQYFIQCEAELKQAKPAASLTGSKGDALRLAADLSDQLDAAEKRCAEQAAEIATLKDTLNLPDVESNILKRFGKSWPGGVYPGSVVFLLSA